MAAKAKKPAVKKAAESKGDYQCSVCRRWWQGKVHYHKNGTAKPVCIMCGGGEYKHKYKRAE